MQVLQKYRKKKKQNVITNWFAHGRNGLLRQLQREKSLDNRTSYKTWLSR